MKHIFFLILVASVSMAALEAEVMHYLNVTTSVTCPGDKLHVLAMGSDGIPGADIALRLSLIEPYAGLRAIMHTDANGTASVQLTRTGLYRLRIYTDYYNHDEYVEFNYSEMCPPPPPKPMELEVLPNCTAGALILSITSNGTPLQDVLVRTGNWSSLTGLGGIVSFPLEEGLVYLNAEKTGYAKVESYQNISCAPPPQPGCIIDEECAQHEHCSSGSCINVTGTCGYAANHGWIPYECCSDSDCGNGSVCTNQSCISLPPPPANLTNETNGSVSVPESVNQSGTSGDLTIYIAALVAFLVLLFFIIKKVAGTR